ncbi:unnamed protein product [Clonostachys rosea]|uniref:Clr5 domain-containing protein n=1 Tax=Bionectria ochroleuca TaxID=29856 RepID=A0ABY6U821_BIOOC|nr:unnamed protein product [Clonostachys rosea]
MGTSKIPPSEWETYRHVIRGLYMDKNMSLDALVEEMKTVHEFIATKSQYIRKLASWKIGKNATTNGWKNAAVAVEKRKRQGKESEIYIDGKLVPSEKMKKEITRHLPPYHEFITMSAQEIDLPRDFVVQTPPATTFHSPQLHARNIQLHGLPWMKFWDSFTLHSTSFTGSVINDAQTDLLERFLAPARNSTIISTSSRMVQHYNRILPGKGSNKIPFTEISSIHESWIHFISYFAYLASNNLLNPGLIQDTLECIATTEDPQALRALLRLNDPTIELCAPAMFSGAVCYGFAGIVQFFLWSGYDPESPIYPCYRLYYGSTALEIAVRRGHALVVRLLLKHGANPNRVQDGTMLPLCLASRSSDKTITELLLKNGGDPNNAQCIELFGSLLACYIDEHTGLDMVQLFLTAGAKIDGESPGSAFLDDDVEDGDAIGVPLVKAVHRRNTQVARFLLGAGADVNQIDMGVGSAIQIAVEDDDMNMVKLLVEAGAEVNLNKEQYSNAWSAEGAGYLDTKKEIKTKFFSPLQLAARANNSEIIQYLLQCNAEPNDLPALEILERAFYEAEGHMTDVSLYGYETPLSYAVRGGDLHLATLLLDSGANPNAIFLHGHTALGNACRAGAFEMVKLLLAYGAQYNPGSNPVSTPLQLAILHKDPILVENLLRNGADIHAPPCSKGGRTALQAAAQVGNSSLFKRLLHMGAEINAPAAVEEGLTCLQASILSENDEIIRIIINHGGAATVNSIFNAVQIRSPMMIDILFSMGANVNSPGIAHVGPVLEHRRVTPLVLAIWMGDADMIHKLLHLGANVSHIYCEFFSILPLHQAIRACDLRTTKMLLAFDADPNQLEPDTGETPLSLATAHINTSPMTRIIRELVNHNADVNIMAKGRYPVEGAIMSHELMGIFIEARADINIPGDSLLARAICGGSSAIRLLLDNTVDLNSHAKECGTPLQAAITIGNVDLVAELIRRGADVNAYPNRLVAYATELENQQIVELLLEKGADTDSTSPVHRCECTFRPTIYIGNRTALVAAAEQNNFDIVKALIERGANVEADNGFFRGATPLQAASINDNLPMVSLLLENGANVNAKPKGDIFDNYGPNWDMWRFGRRTVLQAASENRNLELAQLLIKRGAKVNMGPFEKGGATALQLAAINGDMQMVVLLLENGAEINAAPALKGGRTALEGAAEHGRLDMVHLLLQNDEDETGIGARCANAARYADEQGHSRIATILREWRRL